MFEALTKFTKWLLTLPACRVGWATAWGARRTVAHRANGAALRAGGAASRASKAASNSSSLSVGLTAWF